MARWIRTILTGAFGLLRAFSNIMAFEGTQYESDEMIREYYGEPAPVVFHPPQQIAPYFNGRNERKNICGKIDSR